MLIGVRVLYGLPIMSANNPKYQKKYGRKHYLRNLTKYKTKATAKRKANVEFVETLKKNLKCSRCQESDSRCIDFHHCDPKKKVMTVSRAASNGWSVERILKEIAKCIPLCSNCHRKEHGR